MLAPPLTAMFRLGANPDADAILLAAAAGGADLADLAGLPRKCSAAAPGPDSDADGGLRTGGLRLDLTLHDAGRVQGGPDPQCAAALQAVLEALGKKSRPGRTSAVRASGTMTRWRKPAGA